MIGSPAAAFVGVDGGDADELHDGGVGMAQSMQITVLDAGPGAGVGDALPDPGGRHPEHELSLPGERIDFVQDVAVTGDQALAGFVLGILFDQLVVLVIDAGLFDQDGAGADIGPAQAEDLGAAQGHPCGEETGAFHLAADVGQGEDQTAEVVGAVDGRFLLRLFRGKDQILDRYAGGGLDQALGALNGFAGVGLALFVDGSLHPGAGQILDAQRHQVLQVVPGLPVIAVDGGWGDDTFPGPDIIGDGILHQTVVRLLGLDQAGLGGTGFGVVVFFGLGGDGDADALDHDLVEIGAGFQAAGSGHADLRLLLQLLLAAPVTEHGILWDLPPTAFTFQTIFHLPKKKFSKMIKSIDNLWYTDFNRLLAGMLYE